MNRLLLTTFCLGMLFVVCPVLVGGQQDTVTTVDRLVWDAMMEHISTVKNRDVQGGLLQTMIDALWETKEKKVTKDGKEKTEKIKVFRMTQNGQPDILWLNKAITAADKITDNNNKSDALRNIARAVGKSKMDAKEALHFYKSIYRVIKDKMVYNVNDEESVQNVQQAFYKKGVFDDDDGLLVGLVLSAGKIIDEPASKHKEYLAFVKKMVGEYNRVWNK